MKLKQIIQTLEPLEVRGSMDVEIRDICSDSRRVTPGALFVAVKGFESDGHSYIASAVEKGAAAILCEQAPEGVDLPVVRVENSRRAVALAADAFYGHPSGKLSLVGITGTNGKTTTVTLLYHLFQDLGYHCGLLSTIANYVGNTRLETANTTADPTPSWRGWSMRDAPTASWKSAPSAWSRTGPWAWSLPPASSPT